MQFDSFCLGLLFILFLFCNCANHFKVNNLPLVNTLVHKQLVFTCGVTTRIKVHKSDKSDSWLTKGWSMAPSTNKTMDISLSSKVVLNACFQNHSMPCERVYQSYNGSICSSKCVVDRRKLYQRRVLSIHSSTSQTSYENDWSCPGKLLFYFVVDYSSAYLL